LIYSVRLGQGKLSGRIVIGSCCQVKIHSPGSAEFIRPRIGIIVSDFGKPDFVR